MYNEVGDCMKSIFEKAHNLNINDEYKKIVYELEVKRFWSGAKFLSFFEYLDYNQLFKAWKYRDTILTTTEYLNFIEIKEGANYVNNIDEEKFLYFLQFILNMRTYFPSSNLEFSFELALNYLFDNISLILSKMGYKCIGVDDRKILTRINPDIDSIGELLEEDLQKLLVSYTDFRIENDTEVKKSLLKKIDLKIEEEKACYKQIDNDTYNIVGKLVNDIAGINHPKEIEDKKLLKEYCDDCFILMLHLIRSKEYTAIKKKYKS